ncbi:MAG: class I SAM-dependent methyltransferase [Spirochaetes bacterium]|nr:class I SAM-dependent methyltransferase [Spirochaetota bacterium]
MGKLFTLLLVSILASPSAFAKSMVEDEKHGRKKDSAHYIRLFEAPDRAQWQKPDDVIRTLDLKKGQRIADIGAGSGYFTRRFARAVAPGGEAVGYDVDPGMVSHMKKYAAENRIKNFRASLISPDSPALDRASFDMIFICNTYHHMENRVAYLKKIKAALKTGGRVVIVDYRKGSKGGPPETFKLEDSRVVEEFAKAGYRLLKKHDFLPNQYILEFAL